MANYRISIEKSAETEWMAIPFPFRRQINAQIHKLKAAPKPAFAAAFSNSTFAINASGWLIVYEVDDDAMVVRILALIKAS